MYGEGYCLTDAKVKDKQLLEKIAIFMEHFKKKHGHQPAFMQIRHEDFVEGLVYPVTIIRCTRNLSVGTVLMFPSNPEAGAIRRRPVKSVPRRPML